MEMIEGLEPLYQRIAESIEEAISDEWATAQMEAIFFRDGIDYLGEYIRKTDGVARGYPTSPNGESAFRELRECFEKSGQPLWGRACFELNADGNFNMKWDYDNCDENGYFRSDEEVESQKREERYRRLTSD